MIDPPSPDPCQGCPQTVAKLWTFRILLHTTANIPRNTTLIRPFRARTCTHSLACWKVETPCGPSCSSLIAAVRRGLPCQPGLLQVLTCALSIRLGHPPCPSACSHLLCLPVRVEGPPLSGHGPQPVWVLGPGASPPGLHTHQGDPDLCTGRGSWQMLTVGF